MKILSGVAEESSENLDRLKGKGSPVKLIYWGLVDPNRNPNRNCGNGNPVNIQEPVSVCLILTVNAFG